ncbi:hypothetical protein, partial [Dickeya dadantii]|uniref:hypothetical protein n=1 Tax=Dickeya dadantii TaxID=204038 RepID=UPI001F3BFF44
GFLFVCRGATSKISPGNFLWRCHPLAATLRAVAVRHQKFLLEIFCGKPSLAATLRAVAVRRQKFLPEIF